MKHRGVTIRQHGRRWRFKWGGEWVTRDSLDAARRALDRLRDEQERALRDKAVRDEGGITLAEVCSRWLEEKEREIAPATVDKYQTAIRVHVSKVGGLDARSVRPLDLQRFYDGLRWKAAKNAHAVLRQALEWAILNQLVVREGNPAALARPKRARCIDGHYGDDGPALVDEKEVPTAPEVEKLLVDAEAREDRAWELWLRLGGVLGARPGEISGLQRHHLDTEAGAVRIEQNVCRVSKRLKVPKRRASRRTLEVGSEFLSGLDGLLPEEADSFLFPATSRSHLPCWSTYQPSRRLGAACERLGLPHYTPHSLRHFVATHLLDQGWPPLQVARWLGHSDDTMVRTLYANHLVSDTQRGIGQAAARLLPSPLKDSGAVPYGDSAYQGGGWGKRQ